jgi:diguanylate cyclase (GGDEF)-like protein
MNGEGPRGLAHEVSDAFRVVIASALAMVAVLAAATTWFIVVGQPAVDRAAAISSRAQDAAAGLLDEQAMLRAFVVTGDETMLAPYQATRDRVGADRRALAALTGGGARRAVVAFDRAVLQWQDGWAVRAADPATRRGFVAPDGNLRPAALAAFVRAGRDEFVVTQDLARGLIADGTAAESAAKHRTFALVAATAAALLMISAAATIAAVRRRTTLLSRVVGPVGALLAKVQAVGRGEFGASPVIDAPQEILQLRDELADMSASLKLQQQVLAARADGAAASARRLKLVVEFAREISDSLTLSNVLSAVTSASRRLVDSPRARVWLIEDDGVTLRLRFDSITGDAVTDVTQPSGDGGVGRAAAEHRLFYASGLVGDPSEDAAKSLVVAVPLLKGTRVLGVLEVVLAPGANRLDPATVDVLTATAGHAATAIDAALLYALSESLSRSDALTGLGNRRQLDDDLELEAERSGRYHRPLSFLMIDIDRFKAVNDTFGHAVGDSVLREVSTILRDHMRAGDTAYRYGGEEFAVLVRETDTVGAVAIAERLRRAVEQYYTMAAGPVAVTISVGLASVRPEVKTSHELVAAADAALYAAKRAGRNCVRVSGSASGQLPQQRAHVG